MGLQSRGLFPARGGARSEAERCAADAGSRFSSPRVTGVPVLRRITSCCAAPGTRSRGGDDDRTSTPTIPAPCRRCLRRSCNLAHRLCAILPGPAVRLIVPFNAGGSTDLIGRIMCQWLSERLGQSFVVENRPGGGTNIATQLVVNSPPDGYTLLYTVSTHASIHRSTSRCRSTSSATSFAVGGSANCRWCW